MKRYFIIPKLILMLVVIAAFTVSTVSADSWSIPSDKSLEVSLLGLRETAGEVKQRNQWLVNEISRLGRLIVEMTADLELVQSLEAQANLGVEQLDENIKNLSLHEKKMLRQQMSISQIQDELERLKAELNLKMQQEEQFKDSLQVLDGEVKELKTGKKSSEIPLTKETSQIDQYKILYEQSQQKLSQLNKELTQLSRKSEKPLELLQRAQEAHNEYQSKVEMLEDELKIAFEEEAILNNGINEIQTNKQAQLMQINEQIAKAQAKNDELENTLAKAKSKMNTGHIQLQGHDDSAMALEQNLGMIKKEKIVLQQQVSSLKSTLEQLEMK